LKKKFFKNYLLDLFFFLLLISFKEKVIKGNLIGKLKIVFIALWEYFKSYETDSKFEFIEEEKFDFPIQLGEFLLELENFTVNLKEILFDISAT